MKWLRSLWSRRGVHRARRLRPARSLVRARPTLEGLEDRCLMASSVFEFPIPSGNIPGQIVPGTDGALWFTELGKNRNIDFADYIGRITVDGRVTEFKIPDVAVPQPTSITSGSDKNLWFTLANSIQIGRITPQGVITLFGIPSGATPGQITAGPDGNLWFTEPENSRVARITTDGVVTEFTLPTPNSQPTGITGGADGAVWFTMPGVNRIGRIGVSGLAISEVQLPTSNAQPNGITLANDSTLWFAETAVNQIGRLSGGNLVTEFFVQPLSQPTLVTFGPDGNIYFLESGKGTVRSISTTGTIGNPIPIPATNSTNLGLTFGPHSIWFTEAVPAGAGQSKIAVAQVGLDSNHSYVQSLYINVLGRLGADSELDLWVNNALVPSGFLPVAQGIERSPEAKTHLVQTWYGLYLGRPPSPGEDQFWINALLVGLPEEQVLAGILASPEFAARANNLISSGDTDTRYVAALYSLLLRRGGDSLELAGWVKLLPTLGRAGVAAAIQQSGEFRGLTVRNYYRLLLNRSSAPSAAEVNFWVASNLDINGIRIGFESSMEYFRNA